MALMPRSLAGSPLLLLTLVGGHAMAQEAGKWLDRMNRAVDELNYRGTFVHVIDGTPETLNIVHRNVAGNSGERILSVDGPRREIVRENDQVQWILPDQKLVLLETRKDVSPLVSALPSYSADLEPHYEINLRATARIANRPAQMIEIKPRDEFRYGYLLWLDQETAMPLKSQLMDERGRTVEQILFTEIDMAGDIAAADLQPTIDTTGFSTMRPPEFDTGRSGQRAVACVRGAGRVQAFGRDTEPNAGVEVSGRASRLFRRARHGVRVHRGSEDQGRGQRRFLEGRQHEHVLADATRAQGDRGRRSTAADRSHHRILARRRIVVSRPAESSRNCTASGIVTAVARRAHRSRARASAALSSGCDGACRWYGEGGSRRLTVATRARRSRSAHPSP